MAAPLDPNALLSSDPVTWLEQLVAVQRFSLYLSYLTLLSLGKVPLTSLDSAMTKEAENSVASQRMTLKSLRSSGPRLKT